jgi:hypothetical protein
MLLTEQQPNMPFGNNEEYMNTAGSDQEIIMSEG